MKKNMILAAAAAASTILLSLSCTKQDSIQSMDKARVFTASIEQIQTKTTLDGLKVNWSEGDKISIMNGETGERSVYSATPKANGTADFTVADGEKELIADHYFAVYPDYLLPGGEVGFRLPNIQVYETGKLNTPMFAMSDTEELTFKNMCGVVCFALTGSVEIGRIELWADDIKLWGETEVNFETGAVKTIGEITDENNRVTLRCLDAKKNGVKLDSDRPTYFYIYLPETTIPAGKLHATIWGMEDGSKDLKSQIDVTVEANNIYTFEYTIDSFDSQQDAPVTAVERIGISQTTILPGEFTVDANGTKVKFTSGNVVWTNKNGWECELNPGRIVMPFENEKDSVNLFLWHDDPDQARLGQATSAPSTHCLFCDGHKAVFVPERTDNILSVPSMDWWDYILFKRDGTRFVKARLDGMPGLILFPDNYTWTEKVEELFIKIVNNDDSNFNNANTAFPESENGLSLEEFSVLEKAGYVFLPAEASRGINGDGVKVDGDLANENANGYYWGVCDGGLATLSFSKDNVKVMGGAVDDDNKWSTIYESALGASIRLVQVIPSVPAAQEVEQTARY